MGAACSTAPHVESQLLESRQPRSDTHAVLAVPHEPRTERQPALDAEPTAIRSAAEGSQRRTAAEPLHTMMDFIDRRDSDQPDPDIDPSTLPYRIFLRGAMIGCAIVAMPMAVLIWIVVSNGILYRFYPLPSERS